MKKHDIDFVNLVGKAVIQDQEDDGLFASTDWEKVYELARTNSLIGVTYDVAKAQSSLPEELRKKWDMFRFKIFVRQKKHFHMLIDLIHEIQDADIDYAIFKGIVIADCYPNPAYRPSSDSDILVDKRNTNAVCQMIERRGYIKNDEKTKANVFYYKHHESGHVIELHTSVYEDYEGKKIDMLRAADLESPSKRITVDIDGEKIRTLGHNEHLVYQMFHIIKHFMLEGANIRFFTDIALFVNRHIDELSVDYFWNMMDKLNYGFFCENFLAICVNYFGMNESFLNGRKPKASKEVLEAMIIDFIYKGDAAQLRNSDWQLIANLEPYFTGKLTTVGKNKAKRIVHFLFPNGKELGQRYKYAKQNSIFLPVAWVHRCLYKTFWQLFKKKEYDYSAVQKMSVIESRLWLMCSVGLLDEE